MNRVEEHRAQELSEYCFCHYGDRLYATAWALLSPPCDGLYRDAVHDAFIVFQRRACSGGIRCLGSIIDSDNSFRRVGPSCCRYLASIVTYRCAYVMRREARRLEINGTYCREFAPQLVEATDDCCCRQELRGIVRQALEQLPESQRLVLTLREFVGLSYEAICEELELPTRTVETQLRRSREALRNKLAFVERQL